MNKTIHYTCTYEDDGLNILKVCNVVDDTNLETLNGLVDKWIKNGYNENEWLDILSISFLLQLVLVRCIDVDVIYIVTQVNEIDQMQHCSKSMMVSSNLRPFEIDVVLHGIGGKHIKFIRLSKDLHQRNVCFI